MKSYQVYLVGGAVRDALLGLPVTERDWVVVGATPEVLLAQGFKAVGKDFPVFLHPKNQEEYALARTERKNGAGYYGFECDAAPDVTLKDDLKRRDLTINAIAKDDQGHIIDPYGGLWDLEQKILRHVSPAFEEDPLRVLRVARFAARFESLGFCIAPETWALMQKMSQSNELLTLHPNRIWIEWQKALLTDSPWVFIGVLQACGAWAVLFPSISTLTPHPDRLKILIAAQALPIERFAACLADQTVTSLKALFKTYPVPKEYVELALLIAQYHKIFLNLDNFTPDIWVNTLEKCDILRKKERWQSFMLVMSSIWLDEQDAEQAQKNKRCLQAATQLFAMITVPQSAKNLSGPEIKALLHEKRLNAFYKKVLL